MDNYILVGKIINTFGIKGEVKITSNFEYQDRIFIKDATLYIGFSKEEVIIKNVRYHKNNYLILLNNYSNINEVLKYKGNNIYIKRSNLSLKENEYLINDLIGYQVYDKNNSIGTVISYTYNVNNYLLKIKGAKDFYIPLIDNYIDKIDNINKKIFTKNGSDLIL